MCLLSGMDSLWFYHTILFSDNPEVPKLPFPTSESPDYSSTSCSHTSLISEQETSPVASVTTGSLDETSSQESDQHDKKYSTKHENRPTRLNLVSSKTRCHHSSSPLASSRRKSRKSGDRHYSSVRLQKTMSCKSLGELELEEVKGFMDLGYNFKKEKLSKYLMRLIPGLERIDNTHDNDEDEEGDNDDNEEKKGVMRPYLSEAWLVKRPEPDKYSPLMNLRVARVSGNEDMKKHLKCWARTVALAIHQ